MLRRATLLLAAVASCRAGEVDVTVTDCCDATCKGTITKLDNPGTCPTPGDCKAGGSGTLNVDVTDAKMELTLQMGGIKILDKTVDACGDMNIPLPLSLGSVAISALAGCPAKAGAIDVKIDIANKKALPAKITSHSVTKDQDGNTLLCLDLTFTPKSAAAPAPTATASGYTVLVFGDSWGDVGPGAASIKNALKAHNVQATVKNAAIGGTTACGWAKNKDAIVKAAQSKFPGLTDGPDFVWYTAGGNDLINDQKFHSCTKNAKSLDAARGCYTAATDTPIACSSDMFDAYFKAFPKSKIMQCNYDIPCETGSCATGLDQGYLGNYCGKNITCMNNMALKFQDSYVGRLRQKYSEPQYTGLLIGGTVQMAAGIPGAAVGTPVLDQSGPCNMMLACVHPESFSKAGKAIGEAFYDRFFKKYTQPSPTSLYFDGEWEAFKAEHGKSYTPEEEAHRARIFAENMVKAEEVARREPFATFGATQYADLTEEEFQTYHAAGPFFARANASDLPQAELLPIAAKATSVDWREKGAVTAVKDQKQCGSCWAFSTTGNIEGQAFLAGHPLTPLSEQQLISCDKGYGDRGCMGGLPSNAYKYVQANGGLESETDYPLTCTLPLCLKTCKFEAAKVATQITGGVTIKGEEAQMLAWLTKNGPISIGVNAAGSAWQTYKGGIMSNCAAKQPDHGVLIVGYGEGSQPYWVVKNSWNAKWGETGYIRLAYGSNQCNIVSSPTSATVA